MICAVERLLPTPTAPLTPTKPHLALISASPPNSPRTLTHSKVHPARADSHPIDHHVSRAGDARVERQRLRREDATVGDKYVKVLDPCGGKHQRRGEGHGKEAEKGRHGL